MGRTTLKSTGVALVIATAVLIHSVASAETSLPGRLDGETIYRGLLQGEGPVAALFPEIHERVQEAK